MNIDSFFQHHGLTQNPFSAEEARLDPVFERMVSSATVTSTARAVGIAGGHPEYEKILGQIDNPSTSVVFGEKGSGKTAIRLLLGRAVDAHNREHPQKRVLLVAYDDLNLTFDNLLRSHHQNTKQVFKQLRLADHQDAVLSQAMTKLVTSLLEKAGSTDMAAGAAVDEQPRIALPAEGELKKRLKNMPRSQRVDLLTLAALYDQPRSEDVVERFDRMRVLLRLSWSVPLWFWRNCGVLLALVALGFALAGWVMEDGQEPWWLWVTLGLSGAGALLLVGYWLWVVFSLWMTARRVCREMPALNRSRGVLQVMLERLPGEALKSQPLPVTARSGRPASDQRYQLTRQLLDAIGPLGYTGMIVLVDRVDEPTLVAGEAERMRAAIWPMLDNKFLKQSRVGVKLLLPLELRHLLYRETPEFFQEARLDKQHMVDRLTWTGTMLYDLCGKRMQACRAGGPVGAGTMPVSAEGVSSGESQPRGMRLIDLFDSDVTETQLVDALNEMHQPRDAFKFIYRLIQEHCSLAPEGGSDYRIAKLTLESVRREQARRVQEFHRGLSPA